MDWPTITEIFNSTDQHYPFNTKLIKRLISSVQQKNDPRNPIGTKQNWSPCSD